MVGVGVAAPVAVRLAVAGTVSEAGSGEGVAALVDSITVAGGVLQALRINARRITKKARRGMVSKEGVFFWSMVVRG